MSDIAGQGCPRLIPEEEKKPLKEIERSIVKRYRKNIWSKFIKAIKQYNLVEEGDKIAVAISGGKDSLLMAKLFQELKRHGQINFDLEFIAMDPGYHKQIKELLIDNLNYLNIPAHIYESGIFNVIDEKASDYPCYLCARMRRGYLYKYAQSIGCNKIALGHHFDDAIETILMSMLYGGEIKTMMPKLHSTNHEGMELIRPLYLVKEADIIAWKNYHDLQFIQCACRLTENCSLGDTGGGSKRQEMKVLIKKFRQTNPHIDMNIFKSVHNVNLQTIIGYRDGDQVYSFLDDYDQ